MAVPQLFLSSSGPCCQHVLLICACKVIWKGTYLTTWKKSTTLTVILAGKWQSRERASCSAREPGLHHVGEAVKGRLGANGNLAAGEAVWCHHATQSRRATNSRAKGNATGVSLPPRNLHILSS